MNDNRFKGGPKVLFADVETSPILAYVWSLWNNDVGLSMVKSDWHLLSWSAKWMHEKKIMYDDQRNEKDISNDKRLLKGIWDLLDSCDVLVTQNGKKFDTKKLNARFVVHGFQPPSSYKQIDTYLIAKNKFGFTSNRLEYMTNLLCKKNKKSDHKKFPGFSLWEGCLKGNKKAWKEMEKYNKMDVTSLEELYYKLIPWDNSINFNVYTDGISNTCKCGSDEFSKNGFAHTAIGKYRRYKCKKCGAEGRGRKNELSKEKRDSLTVKITD